MTAQFEIAITFIIYLFFFAWLGYRRGFRAELLVFLFALGGWLGLQVFGDAVVQIANLGGKFVSFILSGGLGADSDAAFDALKAAPDIITADNREAFLFMVWVVLVVFAYIIGSVMASNSRRRGGSNPLAPGAIFFSLPPDVRMRGWAVLLGIANGLVYASVFLPRLVALLVPGDVDYAFVPAGAGPFEILGSGLELVFDSLKQLWVALQPLGPLVLLVLLTSFLVIVAGTLRASRGGSGSANANGKASS